MGFSKITFIFIACVFLFLPLGEIQHSSFLTIKTILCAGLILTLGISHGAVDNVLFQYESSISTRLFVTFYTIVMGIVALLWFVFPILSVLLFLLISAYHFGQSQLAEYSLSPVTSKIIYTSWGITILAALIFFNQGDILNLIISQELLHTPFIHTIIEGSPYVLVIAAITCFTLFLNESKKKGRGHQSVLLEIYIVSLIILTFALFDLLLGFTLYFIILHSLKVLKEEYDFLKSKSQIKNLTQFVHLLLPFTLISIFGLALICGLILVFELSISLPILFLLIVSCITVPHSVVMNLFYLRKMTSIS